jgi:hypothetical protein
MTVISFEPQLPAEPKLPGINNVLSKDEQIATALKARQELREKYTLALAAHFSIDDNFSSEELKLSSKAGVCLEDRRRGEFSNSDGSLKHYSSFSFRDGRVLEVYDRDERNYSYRLIVPGFPDSEASIMISMAELAEISHQHNNILGAI